MTTPPNPGDAPQFSASAQGSGGSPAASDQGQQGDQGGGFDVNAPAISQAHMNHLLAEQKRSIRSQFADYDTLRDKADRYDSLVSTAKSAEEQAADLNAQLATRERDNADLALQNQRYRLAGQAGLPADLWDMVGGMDEASIKDNIEKLKRHMGPAEPDQQQPQQGRGPRPTPGQGKPGPSDGKAGGTLNAGRELFQSRNKKSSAAAQA